MTKDAAPPAGFRALLRNRDYRLLFAGLSISLSGSWAYNVGLVVFVFNATHSAGWVAVASIIRFLTALVTSPFGGLIADRVERVRLMVTLDVLSLILQSLLALVAALNGSVILAIIVTAFAAATGSAYDPAARAVTPAVVGEEHLAAANSAQSAVENLAVIVGPGIGALVLLLGPPSVVFAINAATFGLSAVLVSRMRTRSAPGDITEGGTAGPLQQMAAGFKAFFASSTVMLLAGFSIVASYIYGTDTVLFVVVSKQQLGTGSTGYGYLLGALGIGGILMAGFMNRVAAARRFGAIIVGGMAVFCLPTALLPLVHSPVVAAGLEVVRGAGTIVVDVLAITALRRMVKPDVVRRVFGVFFALVLAAISLGALFRIAAGRQRRTFTHVAPDGPRRPGVDARDLSVAPRTRQPRATELARIEPQILLLERLDIFAGATRASLERLTRSAVGNRRCSDRDHPPGGSRRRFLRAHQWRSASGRGQRRRQGGGAGPLASSGLLRRDRAPRTATPYRHGDCGHRSAPCTASPETTSSAP